MHPAMAWRNRHPAAIERAAAAGSSQTGLMRRRPGCRSRCRRIWHPRLGRLISASRVRRRDSLKHRLWPSRRWRNLLPRHALQMSRLVQIARQPQPGPRTIRQNSTCSKRSICCWQRRQPTCAGWAVIVAVQSKKRDHSPRTMNFGPQPDSERKDRYSSSASWTTASCRSRKGLLKSVVCQAPRATNP